MMVEVGFSDFMIGVNGSATCVGVVLALFVLPRLLQAFGAFAVVVLGLVGAAACLLAFPFTDPEVAWLALRIVLGRSEEHTSELQSLMRHSYAVFSLKTKKPERFAHNDHYIFILRGQRRANNINKATVITPHPHSHHYCLILLYNTTIQEYKYE